MKIEVITEHVSIIETDDVNKERYTVVSHGIKFYSTMSETIAKQIAEMLHKAILLGMKLHNIQEEEIDEFVNDVPLESLSKCY